MNELHGGEVRYILLAVIEQSFCRRTGVFDLPIHAQQGDAIGGLFDQGFEMFLGPSHSFFGLFFLQKLSFHFFGQVGVPQTDGYLARKGIDGGAVLFTDGFISKYDQQAKVFFVHPQGGDDSLPNLQDFHKSLGHGPHEFWKGFCKEVFRLVNKF